MTESDGEIEYLEEDAEIVLQCVKTSQKPATIVNTLPSLLVERPRPKPVERKKRKKEEEDSDYDPTEELLAIKKKQPPQKKPKTYQPSAPSPSNPSALQHAQKKVREYYMSAREQYSHRKRLSIRIPDYDDPLCLPVRAIRANESDKKRLTNWNNVCLEHFKYCDEILKPERGDTKKSFRTAVFKNVVNKLTGTVETTIWSKTSVQNMEGDKKSEIFQCVLPRYKEKKVLNNYILGHRKPYNSGQYSEVILSKEDHKDGEALIVYKPKESLSAIYGLIDKRKRTEGQEVADRVDDDSKMYLKELACCRICTSCFQGSWRGAKKHKNKALVCPICARTYVSVYNLLSHLKTHSALDMRRYKKIVSTILADMVNYHYKCRICRQTFDSIKGLRLHTPKHESADNVFKCEVGNHLINVTSSK